MYNSIPNKPFKIKKLKCTIDNRCIALDETEILEAEMLNVLNEEEVNQHIKAIQNHV